MQKNHNSKMIEGLRADLEEAMAEVIIKVQIDAHKQLETELITVIREMGIKLHVEQLDMVFHNALCNISFNVIL